MYVYGEAWTNFESRVVKLAVQRKNTKDTNFDRPLDNTHVYSTVGKMESEYQRYKIAPGGDTGLSGPAAGLESLS